MQDKAEVTTERVAEWLVHQCANQDGWQIDVKIEVIPDHEPCAMAEEDREALREQATAAIQGVHRALRLRRWYEDLATPAPTSTHGGGPWTLDEDAVAPTEGA
jgi:hypothetical protein